MANERCIDEALRGSCAINDAVTVINGERQSAYGNPEDCFESIACMWSNYLHRKLTDNISSKDVAMMMCLLKIAREGEGKGKHDNMVDIIGYAALADDMRPKEGCSC